MKIFSFFLFLLCLSSCRGSDNELILGEPNSNVIWVYLCGLTGSLDSPLETKNRAILDEIGRELHVGFLAIPPLKNVLFIKTCSAGLTIANKSF